MPEDYTWDETKPGGCRRWTYEDLIRGEKMSNYDFSDKQKLHFSEIEANAIREMKKRVNDAIVKSNFLGPVLYSHYKDIVVAGGVFASTWFGKPYKDLDIFILNENVSLWQHLQARMDFKFKDKTEEHIKYLNNPNILAVMNDDISRFQIMLTKHKTREELIADFDFVHCCVSMVYDRQKRDSKGNQDPTLYISRNTYEAIDTKTLVPNCKYRLVSQWRIDKFKNRGWKAPTNPCAEIHTSNVSITNAGSGYTSPGVSYIETHVNEYPTSYIKTSTKIV